MWYKLDKTLDTHFHTWEAAVKEANRWRECGYKALIRRLAPGQYRVLLTSVQENHGAPK